MKTSLKLFFYFISILSVSAQYTDVINSNRPGFSESPYSVSRGVYQLETTFFYRSASIKPTFSIPKSQGFNLFFRTSFFLDKLELNTQVTYQKDNVAFKNIFTSSYNAYGVSNLLIGGKYLLFEQEYEDKSKEIRSWKRRFAFDKKRLIPSVAIYLGINTDVVNAVHKTGAITPKIGVLLQNNLSNYFNIITNFFYDKIGSEAPEFSFIVSSTYNYTDRFSYFFETQGFYNKYQNNLNFGTGLAYLFSPNLQINTSVRHLAEGNTTGNYASVGVSYRFDRHQSDIKYFDDYGNEIKSQKNLKKGFFGRLFNKTTRLFKKKNKVTKNKKGTNQNKRTRPKRVRKKPITRTKKKRKKKNKKRKKSKNKDKKDNK